MLRTTSAVEAMLCVGASGGCGGWMQDTELVVVVQGVGGEGRVAGKKPVRHHHRSQLKSE